MHPRNSSHDSSRRPASPSATLGVPVGSPGFAGTTARTAHAPSADAGAGAPDAGGPELAPFAPSIGSPTDGERVEPVGAPSDDGLTAEGPSGPPTASTATRDVEGNGADGADLADVIDAGDGAPPADAAARGGTEG